MNYPSPSNPPLARNDPELLHAEACDGVARRQFLKLMAASMGLAGTSLSGCRRWPEAQLVPHGGQPPGTAPGRRQAYASCCELGGAATGVMVTTVDGRPIKIEGNPLHPYSLGAADAWTQAGVLEMYDPDRSRQITEQTRSAGGGQELAARSWAQFLAAARRTIEDLKSQDGRGLAVLQGLTSSPTVQRLAQEWQLALPQSRWLTYEPVVRDNEIEGIRRAFGQAVRPVWNFDKASIVVCLDADLFGSHSGRQRWSRQWAGRRTGAGKSLNRWYVAEASPTVTGSVADIRLPVAPSRIPRLLVALATELGMAAGLGLSVPAMSPAEDAWARSAATDLKAHPEASLVVVGANQPPEAHALTWAINERLGSLGTTLVPIDEPLANQGPSGSDIRELSRGIESGEIAGLIVLGGNPCYDAPADAPLDLRRPGLTSIHLSLHFNETSAQATWHVPQAHWLESWGDGRAWDGTYSVRQPMILPLFDGKTEAEMLAHLLRRPVVDGRDLVRETCRQFRLLPSHDEELFERAWEVLLHDGRLENSQAAPIAQVPLSSSKVVSLLEQAHKLAASAASSGVQELAFRLDSSVYDGRFANNGWLQEMPDPISKLTWDNAAWLNPADAAAFGVANGDTCELSLGDDPERRCVVAAYLMPGQASGTIGLSLGYGRTLAGSLGSSIGFNVYPVWTVSGLTAPTFAHIRRLGNRHSFALTQDHHQIDALGAAGRTERIGELHHSGSIYHEATWHEYQRDANSVRVAGHGPQELQLFDPPSDFRQPHAWGMAIDLSKCIGCAACVIACQAENNIPIVGKDQVRRNREMHWIRIDTYFKGGDDQPEFAHMPMTCHHCETAPCEQVCPVAATVHDSEGLNAMVYNRCIGTRYCSNNCPAKVRRFNFYDFHATEPDQTRKPWIGIPDAQPAADIDPLRQLQFNPEVTIRMRGVMEKCTFCTQRIQAAKIAARVANAQGLRDSPLVRDGEVVPACASACPAGAIEFGDLNNPSSRVSQAHADPRAYAFLEELQLRPRTRYLAKLRNPVNGATDSSISEGHG